MIYDQINDKIQDALAEIDAKIIAAKQAMDAKYQERKITDSKSRDKEIEVEAAELGRQEYRLRRERESIREAEFQRLLAEEYGIEQDHPKFGKLYSLAYMYGHSSGFSDIENHFMDLVELVR